MNKILILFAILVLLSCNKEKIPVYAWVSGPKGATDEALKDQFKDYKKKGIDVLMYSGGNNPDTYQRVGKIAKAQGLGFYAWIPTLIHNNMPNLDSSLYAVNGLDESSLVKPAYVKYYKFLCPNRDEVYQYLSNLYGTIADIPEVDGIHLDYIRFPDVILARGLWDKYGLVMDKEYPQFDYCYCDTCVSDFLKQTGIDIKNVEDPSQIEEWKQFRCDLITNLVNRLSVMVHSKHKKITAAVFPGPNSVAKKLVRQEWGKWDIDAYFPMNYNDFYLEDTKWIGKMCKESASVVDSSKQVYSGLFICPDPKNRANATDPENRGLLPEELQAAISESMENGASGICLFTPSRMTKEHWDVFKKAIYKKYQKKRTVQ